MGEPVRIAFRRRVIVLPLSEIMPMRRVPPTMKQMLKYNPMRAEHEMKWYLESRFPGHPVKPINVGWNSRILAFRSGPVTVKKLEPMSFP